MAPSRPRPVAAVVGGRYSWMALASALTAATFVGLHSLNLLGTLPLTTLGALFAVGVVSTQLAIHWWGSDPSPVQLRARLGVQLMSVTLIIYAIGWGPTLAIGYAFVVAGDLEEIGSRVWRPALVWTIVGIAAGPGRDRGGLGHSYVSAPYVHGLGGVVGAAASASSLHLLGTKTAAQEISEGRAPHE